MLTKKRIIELLEEEGIKLGQRPEAVITYYDLMGMIPSVTVTGKGRAKGKRGLYPNIVFEMIKDIKQLQEEGHLLRLVKRKIKERYQDEFMREDLLLLGNLNNFDGKLIKTYLDIHYKSIDDKLLNNKEFFKDFLLQHIDEDLQDIGIQAVSS